MLAPHIENNRNPLPGSELRLQHHAFVSLLTGLVMETGNCTGIGNMAYLTNADLLKDIANLLEHDNNDMANNTDVRILLSKHYDASDLLLVHLDHNSRQATLLSYEGKNKLHQLSLLTSSLKDIIEHQDFYRPIVATALPELNSFLENDTLINNTSISFTPIRSENELIGFLVISHRNLSDLLSQNQRHGLKIIANHFKNFLQGQEHSKNQKVSSHSANHLISRIRTLLQRTPIMINAFDVHRHCILWNAECERVFGWTHRELQELPDPMSLFYPDTEQREAIERVFAFNDGSEFLEWKPQTRWGDQLVTLWANITLPDGSVLCIVYWA